MMSLPQVCKYTKDSIDGKLPALARDIGTLHSADLASLAPTQHLTDAVRSHCTQVVSFMPLNLL